MPSDHVAPIFYVIRLSQYKKAASGSFLSLCHVSFNSCLKYEIVIQTPPTKNNA